MTADLITRLESADGPSNRSTQSAGCVMTEGTDMNQIEKVARGLTKAQREVLRFASNSPICGWVCRPGRSVAGLEKKGLVSRFYLTSIGGSRTGYRQLTPLGLAVRAELERIADE